MTHIPETYLNNYIDKVEELTKVELSSPHLKEKFILIKINSMGIYSPDGPMDCSVGLSCTPPIVSPYRRNQDSKKCYTTLAFLKLTLEKF